MNGVRHDVLNARISLIDTTRGILSQFRELGYVQKVVSERLGELAVLGGFVQPNRIYEGSPSVGLRLIEHPDVVSGRSAATVRTVGSFPWMAQYGLDPTWNEWQMLNLEADSGRVIEDMQTRMLVGGFTVYDPALSNIMASRVIADPASHGLPEDLH